MSEEEKMRGEGGEGEEARVRQDFLALCAGLNMDQVCTSVGGSGNISFGSGSTGYDRILALCAGLNMDQV